MGNEAASVKLLKGWNVVAAPYPVRCRLDPQALSLVTDEGESTLAAAKEAGDFARADAIRDELAAMGVLVEDTPQGTKWHLAD